MLCVDTPDWRPDLVAIESVRYDRHLYDLVVHELTDAGLGQGRLGVAGLEAMPAAAYRYLTRAMPEVDFVDVTGLLARQRRHKSDAEIALLRRAAAVGTEILRGVLDAAVPGATDGACAAAGLAVGARTPGVAQWDISMASGPHSGHFQWPRMPQWDGHREYESGDLIHPDNYGVVDGYIFDMVRSKVVGRDPTARQRRLIQGAADCVHAIIDGIRPGVTCGELHAIGQSFLAAEGFAGETPLSSAFPAFGHHDGLGFESPWLAGEGPDVDEQIVGPVVLSIEAEVAEGDEAAGFEEMVLIDRDGTVQVLTADLPTFPEFTGGSNATSR